MASRQKRLDNKNEIVKILSNKAVEFVAYLKEQKNTRHCSKRFNSPNILERKVSPNFLIQKYMELLFNVAQ